MPLDTTKNMLTTRQWQFYSVPGTFLSNRIAVILVIGVFLFGIGGYTYFEGYNLREAFYMMVITVSTVGYGEVRPLSPEGELFTSVLIIMNFGIFAYVLSVFSFYVVNGQFFKAMHSNLINKKIAQLENHVIVCGYGRYGKEVSQHFQQHNTPYVIVETNRDVIDEIQRSEERLLYIQDDATNDETLTNAGIGRAKALIAALPDDSENLYIVLSARQLNPKINIISRATLEKSQKKLKLAGANHVVMPEQIGGFYMATLVSKPGATEFFSYITRESESDIEFEEISADNMPQSCLDKTIRELGIRKQTGTNIIGFRNPEGEYIVNPGPETKLVAHSSFIVLGTHEQLDTLRAYLRRLK